MRALVFLAFLVVLGYCISYLLFPRRRMPRDSGHAAPTTVIEDLVRDPICHLYLPRSEAIRHAVQGREHFFCSPGCLDKFLALRS